MKKYLFALLVLLPLSLSACGVMVFVARPNAEFLAQTNDMDHSVILDINQGVEDMWFKIKKPADLTSGSVITVTPIPNDISLSKINEINENEIPNPNLNDKVTYQKVINHFLEGLGSKIYMFFFLTPFLFIFAISILIRSRSNKKKNIEDSETLKKGISWTGSAFLVNYFVFFMWFLFGFMSSMIGIGQGGSVTMPGMALSDGMRYSDSDNISIAYSTTTHSGTTLQLIQAENGEGLTSYLERNGLPKSPSNNVVLSRYVKEGYNFAVTYIPVDNSNLINERYIHLSFPSQQLFFPLGVNYADSDDKHAVTVMTLKPVTSKGFSSDFAWVNEERRNNIPKMVDDSSAHDTSSQENLNNKITYYRDGSDQPNLSVVHFYYSKKNYNHDVFMSVGIPFSLKFFEFINTQMFLIIAFALIILFFVYLAYLSMRSQSDNFKKNFLLVSVSLPFILIIIFVLFNIFKNYFYY
jgi:uncharacterized membrane protein YfcA